MSRRPKRKTRSISSDKETFFTGRLSVEAIAGKNLVSMDRNGFSDPYLVIKLGDKKKKSSIVYNTLNPVWKTRAVREVFNFVKIKSDVLIVKIMDYDRFSADDRMGKVVIPMEMIVEKMEWDEWFDVVPQKFGDKVSGKLRLKLQYSEDDNVEYINHLVEAMNDGDFNIIKTLVSEGRININTLDQYGETILHHLLARKEMDDIQLEILNMLFQDPLLDVQIKNMYGNTALHLFCKKSSKNLEYVLTELLTRGCYIDAVNENGETPLHQAVFNSTPGFEIVNLLILNHANLEQVNKNGETPLHYAIRTGNMNLVKFFMIKNAKVEGGETNSYEIAKEMKNMGIYDCLQGATELRKFLQKYDIFKYFNIFVEQELWLNVLIDLDMTILNDLLKDDEYVLLLVEALNGIGEGEYSDSLDQERRNRKIIQKTDRILLKQSLNSKVLSKSKALEWEIDIKDVEINESLGFGTSGQVFLGKYKDDRVAIKILKTENSDEERTEFVKEFTMLIKLSSDYIVHFYGATLQSKLSMVMEFCERGSLYHVLRDKNIEMNWDLAFKFCNEIAKGMQVLHENNPTVIHRDLKTLNVLVKEDFSCKIADFGLSRFDTSTNLVTLKEIRGTYAYIAPEAYDNEKSTLKFDIYGMGIIYWEILFRLRNGYYEIPYSEFKYPLEFTILVNVSMRGLRPTIPSIPPEFNELISLCWFQEPEGRPECSDIIERLKQIETIKNQSPGLWEEYIGND